MICDDTYQHGLVRTDTLALHCMFLPVAKRSLTLTTTGLSALIPLLSTAAANADASSCSPHMSLLPVSGPMPAVLPAATEKIPSALGLMGMGTAP